MRIISRSVNKSLFRGGSAIALALALGHTSAFAQPAQSDDPAEAAGAGESGNENEIVVTGSRIERAGFDQPTPTTVLGDTELRQGAPTGLQQVLAEQPSVRPSVLPATTVGNTGSGTAPVDLRGLGLDRTLTLINGRRFVGSNNLNFVPLNMVERLEVVTGGASAAWGSGAVAGVINIILKDDYEGISLGADAGVSSRGDGERYKVDATFGTKFADGRGHFLIGGEYVDDRGLSTHARRSRPSLGAGLAPAPGGGLQWVNDANISVRSYSGLIFTGALAGQTFNNDGTLRPYRGPDALGVGGEDSSHLWDDLYAASPSKRFNAYARVGYDIGSNARVWADLAYGKSKSDYVFFPDFSAVGDLGVPLFIAADNAFLSPAIQNQLANAGDPGFLYFRAFRDILPIVFDAERESIEGAIGIDGTFGNGWKYSAHYSHGEINDVQFLRNIGLKAPLANAIDAVSSGGQIVCRINADANPANDDPSCRPLNIFGEGNASADAIDYVRADQGQDSTQKLDSFAVEVQGDIFTGWAGPVTLAVGAEARWEKVSTVRPAETVTNINNNAYTIPVYTGDLNGGFNVKEGFAEIVFPLLNTEGVKLEFNGAARYSDYNTSGGIWSWKAGGTARLFNDLLLRVTRSRDIRSPNIGELFGQAINIGAATDLNPPANPPPGYDQNPDFVTLLTSGNPNLVPEISSTLAVGGSYSPSFLRGLNLSVDYYEIKISGAITTLPVTTVTALCAGGDQTACARITRDPVTQTLTQVIATPENLATFQTSGIDFEAAYVTSMGQIAGDKPGTLRFRALATYVNKYLFDNFLPGGRADRAGEVGDFATGMPKWRGTFSATYQDAVFGLDARVRYVGGGVYTKDIPGIVNNKFSERIYVDIGAQIRVMDKFTFFGNIANLFDRDPPFIQQGSSHYDIMGRYFSFGARVNF